MSKDQALVYVFQSCGLRCATGKYYVLSKDDTEWRIRSEVLVLQS